MLDMFKVGIGPSSSHTVAPMKAALAFVHELNNRQLLEKVAGVRVFLYGSLGATGRGHSSDKGVVLGLAGENPATVEGVTVSSMLPAVAKQKTLMLLNKQQINFDPDRDIAFVLTNCEGISHPNAMKFEAKSDTGELLHTQIYISLGGGFLQTAGTASETLDAPEFPFPFRTAEQLLDICAKNRITIAEVMRQNEEVRRPWSQTLGGILQVWEVMQKSIVAGMNATGNLEGPLMVERRAASLATRLSQSKRNRNEDALEWASVFAIAVSEQNAAGEKMVTAPTNGAAGVIPAVCRYFLDFAKGRPKDLPTFFLTAAAIGALYKLNASLSGAEVGCQGEIGVAASMAAGGLCAVMGGTPAQVENAAEIAMEHHLGMTCDPVGGLVQIPCIERNAMGTIKAISAAKMAMLGNGSHYVSLDAVMKTMYETGMDMRRKYKETSRGGLAVHVVKC